MITNFTNKYRYLKTARITNFFFLINQDEAHIKNNIIHINKNTNIHTINI